MKYIKPKNLTPYQQLIGIKVFHGNGHGHVKRSVLNWEGMIRPTPISREYLIRIIYKPGSQPAVFVLEPSLGELAGGREIPHLYSQEKGELCLYRPKYREWKPDQHISQTIIPWIYVWLFFFEEWLLSNEWRGGGEHPREGKKKRT